MSFNEQMFKLMAKHGKVPDAVYAVNWWQVLLADASLGIVAVLVIDPLEEVNVPHRDAHTLAQSSGRIPFLL